MSARYVAANKIRWRHKYREVDDEIDSPSGVKRLRSRKHTPAIPLADSLMRV
jgi:hypothetical protein